MKQKVKQPILSPELGKKMTLFMTVIVLIGAVFMVIGSLNESSEVVGQAIAKPQCNDQRDNDGDGRCDYLTRKTRCVDGSIPGDLDCASSSDNKESPDCNPVPERCDGYDNNCNNQIDEGLPIACSSSTNCGTSGWAGSTYCGYDNNVYRDYTTYQCNFPGTCSSSCSSQTTAQIYQKCTNGCYNGECLAVIVPFDFSVSVSPTSAVITSGASSSTQVLVSLLNGTSQPVSLIASGCPQAATCLFSTNNQSPAYASVLTVTTTAQSNGSNVTSTPKGTYLITVIGTGDGKQRSEVYTLIVN